MTNKDGGWIKISRDIRNHWVWTDPVLLKAWLDILLDANHEDRTILVDKETVTIKRGSTLTSIRKLGTRWRCSFKTVYKILGTLEREQMVTLRKTHRGTLLTIVNYDKFQSQGNAKGNTKGNAEGNAGSNAEGNTEGNTEGNQTRIIKNYNNKNDKERKEKDAPLGYSSTGIPYDHVETVDGEQWFCWKDEQGGWHMENAKKEEYPRW